MSKTTKSIKALLRTAYQVGKESFPAYSHSKSPQKYTQAQLFSCLALKHFLCRDYRGVCIFLEEFNEARAEIGLGETPHYTTLHKASSRLLKKDKVVTLLESTLREFSLKKPLSI